MSARLALVALLASPAAAADPLPPGAFARLGSNRMRMGDDVRRMQFSPDGTLLVAAGRGDIRVWRANSGERVAVAEYPKGHGFSDGRLLNDGTIALVAKPEGKDYQACRFDPKAGKTVASVTIAVDDNDHAAFTADGSLVAATKKDRLQVFDAVTGKERWAVALPTKPTESPVLFPDGKTVAVAFDTEVHLYGADGKLARALKPAGDKENHFLTHVRVSADGARLAASVGRGGEGTLVWAVADGKQLVALKESDRPLGFAPDGTLVTTAKGGLAVWDAAGKRVRTVALAAVGNTSVLSPDATTLAAEADDAVVLYDARTGQPLPHAADPPGLPTKLTLTKTHLTGELGTWGGWVSWEVAGGKATLIRPPVAAEAVPVALSADRKRAVYAAGEGGLVVWEVGADKPLRTIPNDVRHGSTPLAGLSADGTGLAYADGFGVWRVDIATGKSSHARRVGGEEQMPTGFALSPDARLAAVETHDAAAEKKVIEVYDLSASRLVRRHPAENGASEVRFSPDGRRLLFAVARFDERSNQTHAAFAFDTDTGRQLLATPPSTSGSPKLAASADGRAVAVAFAKEVSVYELATGRPRATLTLPGDPHAVAVGADGRTLAASLPGAGPVLLYDMLGAEVLTAAEPAACWPDLSADDPAAAFKAARRLAASGDAAVALLAKQVPPAAPPDAAKLAAWVADLDAPAFAARDRAGRELRKLGELAEPALRRALAAADSAEVRQRIEAILDAAGKPSPDARRAARAVEVLEWVGTPAAKAALAALAGGAEGGRPTRDAAAALARLNGR